MFKFIYSLIAKIFIDFLPQAYNILQDAASNNEALDKMLDLIGSTPFNSEDLKVAGELFFKKLQVANNYVPSAKFQGPVTLFKATDGFVELDEDYGLSKVRLDIKLTFDTTDFPFRFRYVQRA